MRLRGKGIVVFLMFAAVSTTPNVMPSASAQPLGSVCQHVGRVKPRPGLTLENQDLTFSFKGNVGPCQMSDGSTRWGVEFGRGKANGTCTVRTATAMWTIIWNTGERTVIAASLSGAGNVITTSGSVTKGEFTGGPFQDAHFLSGFDPTMCTSISGVSEATYQGVFGIGAAD